MIERKPGRNLVWLASYPRSGNTWTRIFLHNLILILMGKDQGPADINDINKYSTWETKRSHYEFALGKEAAAELTDWQSAAKVRPRVQAAMSRRSQGTLFIKTHLPVAEIHGVPTINPDVTSGAVYIVRNPLDVALSLAPHMGWTLDQAIASMARPGQVLGSNDGSVMEVIDSWSNNVRSWTKTPDERLLFLRYEDIKADPVAEFGKLARHVGFLPLPEHMEKAVRYSGFEVVSAQEREKGFEHAAVNAEGNFFRAGQSGGWKGKLSAEQVQAIVGPHAEMMERFGYLQDI